MNSTKIGDTNEVICPIKEVHLKASFMDLGFLHIQKKTLPFIEQLERVCAKYVVNKEQTFQYSLMEHSFEDNLRLHEELNTILQPLFNEIFENYSSYSGSLLVKPGLSGTEMNLHQDWTFTDEKAFTPCTVWIPLQDTNEVNGSLFFIPKSHHFFDNFRSHHYETARISKDYFTDVCSLTVEKGDLVLFNPATFHGSFSNRTSKPRIAVSITIMDKRAPYVHVKKDTETTAKIFRLNPDCFFKDLAELDKHYAFESTDFSIIPYQHKIPTFSEIQEKMKAHVY